MLVLSRKNRETIVIDGRIIVKVLQIKGNTIRLGIEAPPEMSIRRGELLEVQEPPQDALREQDGAQGSLILLLGEGSVGATPDAAASITYTCAAS